MNPFRRLMLYRRHRRARRAFRQNFIAWKSTGCTAAWTNVNILAARLRELEGKAA